MRDQVWGRANQLVWLDYERPLIMARVIRRSVWWATTRTLMWNENREDWRTWADLRETRRLLAAASTAA